MMQPLTRYTISNEDEIEGNMVADPEGEYVRLDDVVEQKAKTVDALRRCVEALSKVLAGDRDSQACADAHIRGLAVLKMHAPAPTDAPS